MIIQGNELSLFDLVSYYANRNQCACLYFNLDKYNSLDATKKATVTTYYEEFVDDYIMDIIKQGGIFNTIKFDNETAAGINAESWFPKLAQCPDADHHISAYVVDAFGDITWQN
jgi:hypothetical protein|tara:strand:- start:404 stop:745 length:342 start_codon:yes stop_codon:yes gene_type:complete